MHLLRNICRIKPSQIDIPSRSFFGALNIIFNRVNEKRIQEVGPDRACAEWLMRNGAHVRWKGSPSLVSHYNHLPLDAEDKGQYYIEEVFAEEASISHHGFDHFNDCNHITTMRFNNCLYIDDKCLRKLCILSDSLLCLEIIKCPGVCGGLQHLAALQNLAILRLCELQSVSNLEKEIECLKTLLPNCQINP